MLLGAGGASAFTVQPAPYRPTVQFRVSYAGSGTWSTTYHSEPPDGGGKHDTNDAHDSGTQQWAISFGRLLVVPRCGPVGRRRHDACRALRALVGARGSTSATGSVDHRHVDGLYPADNASISCSVQARTPAGWVLHARLAVGYSPSSRAISLRALNPVFDALARLPEACPTQGDAIDGLSDNYFTPGLSFAPGYGPARWFAAAGVEIPAGVLHRASSIRIPLADTAAGTPPAGCAVVHPDWERCSTGGSWTGVLTLTRTP